MDYSDTAFTSGHQLNIPRYRLYVIMNFIIND